jgi:ATP-dependent helicase/nuclease subunit A
MSCKDILAELNPDQRRAATACDNTVVAAGAGSGKTKALTARYAWLIMEKGLKIDQILALTFTNKAANEMYGRIYSRLAQERDDERAREALADFHKARISTLDSFCAGIVRTAARRYGIPSGFAIDEAGVRELALEAALPFVLEKRENPGMKVLLAHGRIRGVAEDLFAAAAREYGFADGLSDFTGFTRNQEEKILGDWKTKADAAEGLIGAIIQELGEMPKTDCDARTAFQEVLRARPPVPCPGPLSQEASPEAKKAAREGFREYFDFLLRLNAINLNQGGAKKKEFAAIRKNRKELKDVLFKDLAALAGGILQRDIPEAVFPLMREFLAEVGQKKRQAGILSFADIAHLALDALMRYPDIRKVYKDGIKAIMIDEFQDNNSLQRDLIFLLAEKSGRMEEGLPAADELEADKLFFVGDEKQSIYRFRGADVAVFRGLAKTFGGALSLKTNYRSRPRLIEAFNRVFGGAPARESGGDAAPALPAVFPPESPGLPDFEAAYTPMYAHGEPDPRDTREPFLHFAFLDKGRVADNGLSPAEIEAAFLIMRIKEMKDSCHPVAARAGEAKTTRPCAWADFAILQRSYANQRYLEKFCKDFDVPFVADRPSGLFTDAPINDLYMLLRLLAYPQDRLAYAAVIRSPFARLGDRSLARCMLDEEGEPFRESLAEKLPGEDKELYLAAGARYRALAEAAKTLPLTELAVRLWYDEGYRYETLWSAPAQVYTELFEVFFKLAQDAQARGKSLASFVDYLEALFTREEKLDDLEIPGEAGEGIRIMSIHKSKGLEFPIVFVYDGAHGSPGSRNPAFIYFHEKWGLTINLPPPEELPENAGNYFFLLQKEEEEQKRTAELRRLLYVAMTRAESCLYFTAALPGQTVKEKEKKDLTEAEYNDEFVRERLCLLAGIREESESKTISSFLDLLLPVLAAPAGETRLFTIEAIPPFSRKEVGSRTESAARSRRTGTSLREAAEEAAADYENARLIVPAPALAPTIFASSLHVAAADGAHKGPNLSRDGLHAIPKEAGLDAADFGTLAHVFLEARLNGKPALIPPRLLARLEDEKNLPEIRAAAERMTQRFVDSALGRLSLSSPYRETEFAILTQLAPEGKTISITGKLDLLFEAENQMHVVDFKTDSEEDPRRHFGQLAVYCRAVGDIFGKPVRAWLFYLRSGEERELTPDIEKVDIEAMVRDYLAEQEAARG